MKTRNFKIFAGTHICRCSETIGKYLVFYKVFLLSKSHVKETQKWGIKSASRGDCEKQKGKVVRFLSQLRQRIRPLYSNAVSFLSLRLARK
jgi:hypothetical protein